MRLVVAEKPSVAAALAAALGVKNKKDGYMEGGGYLISWCVGHLVELAEAAAYGEQYKKWSYDSLPILPQPWQYTVFKDRQKQFKILKDLMRRSDISEVVNACDAGREGELIFRLVYHAAGCDKPFSRLWISSMEKSAIKKGFAKLKPGKVYDALYASALCRAKADWIIGINATRLFSVLHGKTLNVGRVQTPTLKMLADRDAAITSFKKETYHIVRLDVGGAEAASERISDAAKAEAVKTACEASQAVCVSVRRERKTEQPLRLFDLTGLQREANRMRRSEILGLRWRNVDLENNTFDVSEQLPFKVPPKTKVIEEMAPPKSNGRKLPITELARPFFLKQFAMQEAQREQAEKNGKPYYDNDLVVAKPDGSPISASWVSSQFGKLLEDLDMPHIRFHDLRHTAATNMHQLTGDFYTVGEVLGHTLGGIGVSLGLSMNFEAVTARYVDVRLERKKEVLDAYHGTVKQADPAKAEKAEPKKAKKKSSDLEL